jgi:protein-tyrosine phosphatase
MFSSLKFTLTLAFVVCFNLVFPPAQAQNAHLNSESIWAERISATAYKIHQKKNQQLSVFQGNIPFYIDWTKPVLSLIDSAEVAVLPSERLYFGVIIDRDTLVFSERRLWIEKAPNFRDLGGLRTQDGRRVRWGKLFRCGDMSSLTEADLKSIERANVRNVVDLRNEQEVKQNPDRYPNTYAMNRVWSSITPANGESMKQFYALIGNPKTTTAEAEAVFAGFYSQMPKYIKNYAPLFETLMKTDSAATLFHCTAGKDRTGLGSALILSALGVAEADIVEEYYLSNRYTQYLAQSGMMRQLPPHIGKVLAGVEPQYIQASLNQIKQQYGSIEKCLEDELGLDAAKRQQLRDRYLH